MRVTAVTEFVELLHFQLQQSKCCRRNVCALHFAICHFALRHCLSGYFAILRVCNVSPPTPLPPSPASYFFFGLTCRLRTPPEEGIAATEGLPCGKATVPNGAFVSA